MYIKSYFKVTALPSLVLLCFLLLGGSCKPKTTALPTSVEEADAQIQALQKQIEQLQNYKETTLISADDINPFAVPDDTDELDISHDSSVIIKGVSNLSDVKEITLHKAIPYADDFKATIPINGNSFLSQIQISEAGFYVLKIGQKEFDIFLKPSRTLGIKADTSTYPTLTFINDLAIENNFLLQRRGRSKDWYRLAETDYTLDKETFLKKADNIKKKFEADLSIIKDSGNQLDEDFLEQEQGLYDYGYKRVLLKYALTNDMSLNDLKSDNIPVDNPALFGLYAYRKWAFEYLEANSSTIDLKKVKNKTARTNHFEKKYAEVSKFFQSPAVSAFLKTDVIYEAIARINSPKVNQLVLKFKKDVADKGYHDIVDKRYTNIIKARNGTFAPEIKGVNSLGERVQLSQYKGKYVYIFTWATWCGPCKMEIEPYHNMMMEFEDKNIEFLGISIDKDKSAWQASLLENTGFPGNQILVQGNWKSPIITDYSIAAVPQAILISPDGIIIDDNAPKPSRIREVFYGIADL